MNKADYKFELSVDSNITAYFNYKAAHPGTGPTYSCGGTPPEDAEVEDLTVMAYVLNAEVDVTDLLDEKTIDDITFKCFEHAQGKAASDYEDAMEAKRERLMDRELDFRSEV